jgi:hypothetical protein
MGALCSCSSYHPPVRVAASSAPATVLSDQPPVAPIAKSDTGAFTGPTKEQLAENDRKTRPFMERWAACTVKEATNLALAPGETNEIVSAALTSCRKEQTDFVLAATDAIPGLSFVWFRDNAEATMRDSLALQVLRIRAMLTVHAPAHPPTQQPPASVPGGSGGGGTSI